MTGPGRPAPKGRGWQPAVVIRFPIHDPLLFGGNSSMMRHKFLCAILAGIALAVATSPARASFQVTVFDDGVQSVFNAGNASNFGTPPGASTAHFNITVSSITNFPGTPPLGSMTNTTNTSITATGAGNHTLKIVISENGWTAPAGN